MDDQQQPQQMQEPKTGDLRTDIENFVGFMNASDGGRTTLYEIVAPMYPSGIRVLCQ